MLFPPSHRSEPARVVITGAGIITALGCGWKPNAIGFRTGRVASTPVTLFDVSRQRVKTAAQVEFPDKLPATKLTARQAQRLERATKLLLFAAWEAWSQAGWEASENIPTVLATTSGGMSLGEEYYRTSIQRPNARHGQPTRVLRYLCQQQPLDLQNALGYAGPITIIANACASGSNAIGHAYELVRNGRAERVLTGGYDALSHMVFSGFDSLQALSPTTCRPFDAHRDGLLLGEGGAVLCLETFESAKRRGAEILGEIAGYGSATDSHHLTQPHPNGDAALITMSAACERAKISPEQIGYINAHGTGTPLNDVAEAHAINRWAGHHAKNIPVSSTKPSVGHILGGAGAVEAVICLMALREQWLPPTSTLQTLDPICQFPFVSKPTDATLDHALSNSFGFGGSNASIILRRWV